MVEVISMFHQSANNTIIIVFLVAFMTYYMFITNTENAVTALQFFFYVALSVTLYMLFKRKQDKEVEKTTNLSAYIDKLEDMVRKSASFEMLIATVYKVHKPLTSLNFIRNNDEAKQLLYDLRFLLIYDNENLLDFTVYLEYFLKTHFNMMIGKYDVHTFIDILRDIRAEMLNLLHTCHFNIPNLSTVYDSTDLDENLKMGIKRTLALTYKMIKIVFRKYSKDLTHDSYGYTVPYDKGQSHLYNMY